MSTRIWTDGGKVVGLNRIYKATPDYTAPSKLRIGIKQGTPLEADTSMDQPVPVDDGTLNDDGSNQLTGANGGEDTTDNTTRYKPGAGGTDNTSQNLITNTSSINKDWSIANLATAGTIVTGTYRAGLWIYIIDQTTLDYLETSACIELRLGSDSSNYYYKQWDKTDLEIGWNFLQTEVAVEDLDETGTVSGNIDYFMIRIVTGNATDSWDSGDVLYDTLRTWEDADELMSLVSGYPQINESEKKVTLRFYLTSTKANGFDINATSMENTDATPIVTDIDEFTSESKSDTDELAFIVINKAEQG